jgi:ketosteroid isomerase-like protein
MTSNRSWTPFAARAALAFAASGVGLLTVFSSASAQTPAQNKAAVTAKFDAWKAGTGNPFELLADEANWTIEGNSVAARTYATRADFLREVIQPFNARLAVGIRPTVKSITAEGDRVVIHFDAAGTARDGKPYVNTYAWFFQMKNGRVVRAAAFFDTLAFDDLWTRVSPAE